MKKDLVSVIIPIYKIEDYIYHSVESVVNQTYQNIEIILVDDGSPDKCPKICDEWAEKDNRVKVIHKKNGGLSDARNAGLDIAKGNYIIFLDGDDKMDVDAVKILYETIIKNNADIVMTDYCYIKAIDEIPNVEKNNYVETIYEGKDIFELIYNKKHPKIMLSWGKIYKKEIFDDIRFPKGKIHEDDYVLHRVLHKTNKFVHISTELFLNSLRPGSITASKFTSKRFDALDAILDRVEFCKKEKPEYYQKSVYKLLKVTMLYYTYARMSKLKKEEYKHLLEIYNEYYKLLENKPLLAKAFKYFKNTTYFALSLYVKKNKLLYQ